MKKIKFRGKSCNHDGYDFGDLRHHNGEIFIDGYRVKPESVAQLVGYDADGKEVYEGDKLENIHNPDFTTTAYFDVFPEQDSVVRPDTFTEWKLKEAQDETN